MAKLEYVEGIGTKYADKLRATGVASTDGLLKAGRTRKGRKQIADSSGISEKLVLTWVNHVDLFRIKGVGEEYADLLEAAGVDTVVELAQRKADNLHAKMAETNAKHKRVRQLPALSLVEDWVAQAKKLPRGVEY